MKVLYIIPARGGSKGIKNKNRVLLCNKPLISYTIETALEVTTPDNICISTDDVVIGEISKVYGIELPFIRPDYLSSDDATTNDVLLHALAFYESKGINYDVVVLLQPTSPLRKSVQIREALSLFNTDIDVVVSVKHSKSANVICNESESGFLEMTINKNGDRRQDIKEYYEYNGAIYIINAIELKKHGLHLLKRKVKYIMDEYSSIDIDSMFDLNLAECIINLDKDGQIL